MNENFDEIRQYGPGEVKQAVEALLHDRQFMAMLRGFLPLPKGVIRFLVRTMCIGIPKAVHGKGGEVRIEKML